MHRAHRQFDGGRVWRRWRRGRPGVECVGSHMASVIGWRRMPGSAPPSMVDRSFIRPGRKAPPACVIRAPVVGYRLSDQGPFLRRLGTRHATPQREGHPGESSAGGAVRGSLEGRPRQGLGRDWHPHIPPGPRRWASASRYRAPPREAGATETHAKAIHTLTVIYVRRHATGISNTFEVLSEPSRRCILDLLLARERPVGDLVDAMGVSQPAVSKHLRVLRQAGLVEFRADAQRRVYRVRTEPLHDVDAWLAPYRERWASTLDALGEHLASTAGRGQTTAPVDPDEWS
jgi:DNA-binding transcriptional ArsR family regulator